MDVEVGDRSAVTHIAHTHTPCHVATVAITLSDVSQINCCSLLVVRLRRFQRGKDSLRPSESGL